MCTGKPKLSAEAKERRRSDIRNAASLMALYAVAKRWGHKPGWAEKIWRSREGKKKPAGMPAGYFHTANKNVDWSGL